MFLQIGNKFSRRNFSGIDEVFHTFPSLVSKLFISSTKKSGNFNYFNFENFLFLSLLQKKILIINYLFYFGVEPIISFKRELYSPFQFYFDFIVLKWTIKYKIQYFSNYFRQFNNYTLIRYWYSGFLLASNFYINYSLGLLDSILIKNSTCIEEYV